MDRQRKSLPGPREREGSLSTERGGEMEKEGNFRRGWGGIEKR